MQNGTSYHMTQTRLNLTSLSTVVDQKYVHEKEKEDNEYEEKQRVYYATVSSSNNIKSTQRVTKQRTDLFIQI